MRSLLAWLNARRRLVAVAMIGLVGVIVLSAGPTPEDGEWTRLPDLGSLLVFVLGTLALMGLVVIVLARPKARSRRAPGELRSLRAAVIMTLLIVAAAVIFGPAEVSEPPPAAGQPETATTEDVGVGTDTGSGLSGTDTAALVLILVIITAVFARAWRRSSLVAPEAPEEASPTLHRDIADAVVAAHDHLRGATDARTAVMLAYASLEHALTEHGLERHRAETPSEHLGRVLVDLPALATPAVRLGELYEIARFSKVAITESERAKATQTLHQARNSLSAPESTPL